MKASPKFKKGDLVIRTTEDYGVVKVGKLYTVEMVNHAESDLASLDLVGVRWSFTMSKFELYTPLDLELL